MFVIKSIELNNIANILSMALIIKMTLQVLNPGRMLCIKLWTVLKIMMRVFMNNNDSCRLRNLMVLICYMNDDMVM